MGPRFPTSHLSDNGEKQPDCPDKTVSLFNKKTNHIQINVIHDINIILDLMVLVT